MKAKWFEEEGEKLKSNLKIRVKKKILSKKTKFQKLEVYETESFGKLLVLDDAVMLTEFDEFSYHEMIVHVPLLTHKKPEKVAVIGGGDGGAVREILKHKTVKRVDLIEIDEEVVKTSLKYFPKVSKSLKDKRVKIYYEDGFKFLKEKKNEYDAIIVDSTDPVKMAKKLFGKEFYKMLYESLKKDGIAVTQSENFFRYKDLIKQLSRIGKKIFPIYEYYWTAVPTYPDGIIGFSLLSKKYLPFDVDAFKRIKRIKNYKKLNYFNEEIFYASFALPSFIKKIIE